MGRSALLSFLAVLLLSGYCFGDPAEAETPAAPAVIESAPGVETSFWFPKYGASLVFPAGEVVDVIAGFHNGFDAMLNITNITGSLRDVRGWGFDFSPQNQWVSAPAGQDVSLPYQFYIDKSLPALKFQVALRVWYLSEETPFVTTFFNQTITIVEKSVLVDTEQIFMWIIIAVLLALPVWAGYRYLQSLSFFRKATKRAPAPRAATTETNSSDWLAGTFYNKQSKPKAPAKAKSAGVKNVKAKAG